MFVCGLFISNFKFPNQQIFNETENQTTPENIQSSDIAGTDLYAEKINAYVASNHSIIKQSLFTNDTSILPQFDVRDPAFYKCNVLISVSNGIVPEIFPRIATEQDFSNQYEMSFNGFSGFLYYDEEVTQEDAKTRADRAIKIIKEKFQVDLIPVNTTEPNFYPFVGNYPDWDIYIDEITHNIPKDGYWKALDVERLTSSDYLDDNHLSSTYFLINSLDILEKDFLDSDSQVNFNIDSIDMSFLQNLQIEDIFSQFFGLNTSIAGINETIGGFESFNEIFGRFSLSNESHYASLMIQYEGVEEAIKKIGDDEYSFNLWKAMGYDLGSLRPSEKVFIALLGAFMSEIDIQVLCSEIINNTPEFFSLYDFLLEQLQQIFFYADIDIDIDALKDYLFELIWVDNGGIKQSYIKPRNLNNSADYINLLPLLGFQGISGILTGIFNPINQLTISYHISNSEPNLLITKNLIGENASFGTLHNYDFNITIENIGNETAWGVPTLIPLELEDIFILIAGPLSEDLMDAIWEVVKVEYPGQYDSLDDFFNFDEDPRLFYLDSLGSGFVDTYFPDLNNLTNIFPYNQDMDDVIDILSTGYPQIISGLLLLGITTGELKETFTNEYSIWNVDNWYLAPGQSLSYIYSNFSISNLDSFSPFYRYNFTIKTSFPQLPAIISGFSLDETDPSMALLNDDQAWIISSEEKYIDTHDLEVQFLFQNNSFIDLENNSLDQVSILINYSDPSNVAILEIFNFSSGEFIDISPYLDSIENVTNRYSFINSQESLEWLFDPSTRNNHSIILRLRGSDTEPFNLSINDLDIEFSYRDTNHYRAQGARIFYSTESGNVHYIRRSNSISISTHDMASIITHASLSNYNSRAGEENLYTLQIQNIGSQIANSINISLISPGIVSDSGNFTIENNNLVFLLDELAPFEEKVVQFKFYTPNSILIRSLEISYNSTTKIENLDSYNIKDYSSDIYGTAKIDYFHSFPFLNSLKIEFSSSSINPSIGEEFNLTVKLFNDGYSHLNISGIKFFLNDRYGDLIRLNESQISFPNLVYHVEEERDFSLLKSDWKAYYYAPVNFLNNIDNRLTQISKSDPIILGFVNFTIEKEISKNQIEIGEIVEVTIKVTNEGNICIKNLILSDDVSFTQVEFSLVEGRLIHEIDCLSPGDINSFSYKIMAKNQLQINLKPAKISYYYLKKNLATSNIIQVKTIIPLRTQALFVIIPSTVTIVILLGYLFEMKRYKSKRYELRRNEEILFKTKGIDSVIKVEKSLRDYLNKFKTQGDLSRIQKGDERNE